MKKIFILLFVSGLTLSISAQNYFPLHSGNRWQYLISGYGNGGSAFSLYDVSVTDSEMIDNKQYYKLSDHNDFLRYSISDQKIYLYYNNSEYVYIDFTVPADSFYQSFGPWHQLESILSIAGIDTIFNKVLSYGGYKRESLPIIEEIIYTDSIGITVRNTQDEFGFGNFQLIEAIIMDSTNSFSYFTNHYKPEFEIVPITQINNSNFSLNCKVKHKYNRFYGNPPWNTINFIDSVKMFSYYSKRDSTSPIILKIPYHDILYPNDDYLFEMQLDTSLLKKDFNFNYKIYAKDKGIIPEYNYSPDSGYYHCIWEEPSGIESKNNIINDFRLSQNYPNPFNPSTTIDFQLPKESFVTLKVYNILGVEIATLINEQKPAGVHKIKFDASVLPSGLYIYKISTGNFEQTRKMLLLK